ncbi:SDR family oxidoreductase [Tellurirhabdus rosea]|uniref:SDR family oxidoreductase n=1 Tax=Tellurirhabdus rosea TaxID=2674997 RepID=UPI002255CF4D|nr:SDR family oxidoreductase [Tellurirhabdus rosea]
MNPLIVVTGATKGIGRAVVETFMTGGYDAVVCARSEEDLSRMSEELTELMETLSDDPDERPKLHTLQADVSKRADLDRFVHFVHSLERPVDVLVNNAGVFLPGQIHNEAEGTLETQMETNLYSVYHLTRGLLSGMMERQRGHIFMMGSTASITAYPNGGSYCISKFALMGLTKVLREELKPHGVKVTILLPGATLTNSWAGTNLPESRFMEAEDVASVIWSACHLSAGAVVEEILLRPQLGDIK